MIPHETRISNFIKSSIRNEWQYSDLMKVYIRKGYHALPETKFIRDTLDVANVEVSEPHRGQGLFTHWLTIAEQQAKKHGFAAVYVESVLNPRLADWLVRRGYRKMGPDECPNFYRYCSELPITQMGSSTSVPSATRPD